LTQQELIECNAEFVQIKKKKAEGEQFLAMGQMQIMGTKGIFDLQLNFISKNENRAIGFVNQTYISIDSFQQHRFAYVQGFDVQGRYLAVIDLVQWR
jgi:hypothetical protein